MTPRAVWMAAGAALAALPAIGWACADTSCAPAWKLDAIERDCASRAILAPGNDTRVNLMLLLRSKAGMETKPGLSYPKEDYNSAGYGRTFLDWHLLNDALFKVSDKDAGGAAYAGSRCASLSGGEAAFVAAVRAGKGIAGTERDALVAARKRVSAACGGSGDAAPAAWPDGIGSPAGKAFLGYLKAADAFYAERWDEARTGFSDLSRAPDPWVRETAAYMQARTDLNAAQAKAFDEYGWYEGLAKVDQAAVARAGAALNAYLAAWPGGTYAASARGLQRRALWLAGDTQGLANAYAGLLATVSANEAASASLIEEIDNKLLFAGDRDPAASGPLLLATLDLLKMRAETVYDDDGKPSVRKPAITAADIAAQAPAFAGEPELYSYVQASYAFYIENDADKVLRLIPGDSHRKDYSYLGFSRQVLRGMALARKGDPNEAGFWRDLLGGTQSLWQRPSVELGLALNYERHGKLGAVFAPGSPVQDTMIRRILLTHSAGPALLKSAAVQADRPQAETDTALFTLLYKQLTRGDPAGFAQNVALVPARASTEPGLWGFLDQNEVALGLFTKGRWSDGYACPAIAATARKLAASPADPTAQLCLGDFLRLNGFDEFTALDDTPPADELGGFAHDFGGRKLERSAIYSRIIANPSAPATERAYALYRAVNCYAPGGNNSCGGKAVGKAQRQAWFAQLKQQYPTSPWARKLRYFW